MKEPKISIIIPVYNAEKYLKETLQALQAQTWKNWEAICIDDGSKDKSLSILKEFHQKDQRVIFIHQENQGVSKARNLALQNVSGDFICFLDADDLYASCFLETLIKPMIEKDLDVAWCDIQCFFGEKPKSDKKSLSEPVFVDDIFAALINKKPNPQSITPNKLYRAEKIKGIFFDTGVAIAEDYVWSYKVLYQMKKAVYIPCPLYFYRENPMSATRKPDMDKWISGHLFAIQSLNQYFQDKPLSERFRFILKGRLNKIILKHICLKSLRSYPDDYLKYWKKYQEVVADLMNKGIVSYEGLNIKNRLKLWLFYRRKFGLLSKIISV